MRWQGRERKWGNKLVLVILLGAFGLLAGFRVDFAAVPTAQGAAAASRVRALSHFSQAVSIRYWFAHPDQAPAQLRARFQQIRQETAKPRAALKIAPTPGVFNLDSV